MHISMKKVAISVCFLVGALWFIHPITLSSITASTWVPHITFSRNSSIYSGDEQLETGNELSFEDIMKYFFETNSSSCRVGADFGWSLGASHTMGMAIDGNKAVCLDPGVRPTYNNCLVYSFGVRGEWSFEERMQDYGCDVYAFDPSMDEDDHQHSERVWFYNLGLNDVDMDSEPETSWKLKTLLSIYEMLQDKHGPRIIDYLKMDVEFSEWLALPQIFESGLLKKVKQIGMDVHMHRTKTLSIFNQYYGMIRSLEKDHGFYRFSSRTNPWAHVFMSAWGRYSNYAFEMAWYNSRYINQTFTNDPYVFW